MRADSGSSALGLVVLGASDDEAEEEDREGVAEAVIRRYRMGEASIAALAASVVERIERKAFDTGVDGSYCRPQTC